MILILSALALAGMQIAEPVRVEAYMEGEQCRVRIDGQPLTKAALEQTAQTWTREKREIHVTSSGEVPYRCVGGTIFTIQKAGVKRIGFVSEPDPRKAMIYVSARCRIFVDSAPVKLAELRRRAAEWSKTQPDIHFIPDRDARYRCVNRVLQILKEARVAKLGFVGNAARE